MLYEKLPRVPEIGKSMEAIHGYSTRVGRVLLKIPDFFHESIVYLDRLKSPTAFGPIGLLTEVIRLLNFLALIS